MLHSLMSIVCNSYFIIIDNSFHQWSWLTWTFHSLILLSSIPVQKIYIQIFFSDIWSLSHLKYSSLHSMHSSWSWSYFFHFLNFSIMISSNSILNNIYNTLAILWYSWHHSQSNKKSISSIQSSNLSLHHSPVSFLSP